MKIKTTVLCLPVTDLRKTVGFYQEVFGLSDAHIEEGILALELPNMSLFLMEKGSYESYTRKANRAALMPGASAPAVISCAVETKQDVDRALEMAARHGGSAPGVAEVDASSGGYTGYVTDPEGHLWELVCPNRQQHSPDLWRMAMPRSRPTFRYFPSVIRRYKWVAEGRRQMSVEALSEYERKAIAAIAQSDPQGDILRAQLAAATCGRVFGLRVGHGGTSALAVMESAGQRQTFKRSIHAASMVVGYPGPGTDVLAMTRGFGAAGERDSLFLG